VEILELQIYLPKTIPNSTITQPFHAIGIASRLDLDTKKQLSVRMFLLEREEESSMDLPITLHKQKQHCHTQLVYLIVSFPSVLDQF
jgi:hypothetical protein